MAESQGKLVAWSTGMSVASGTLATLIATSSEKWPDSDLWFRICLGTAILCTAVLLIAGLIDLISWLQVTLSRSYSVNSPRLPPDSTRRSVDIDGRRSVDAPNYLVMTSKRDRFNPPIPLTGAPIIIGRDINSTLYLSDDYVSPKHARLYIMDGRYFIEDLGSTNGTYYDENKIKGPTPVEVGVPIRIGRTIIELRP